MASYSGRDEKGRYEASHTISKEDVFDAMEPLEPYSTTELADQLGAPRRTVFNYLDELSDEGLIKKKKPSATRVIWMRGQ